MDRRSFIRTTGAGAVGVGVAACATPSAGFQSGADGRLVPVRASWDRIVRTTVGLRPHRPEGFVVRAEPLGDRLLIHNYGHGGAGMSLSWGTAELAADLAVAGEARRVAVLGCGVVGLTTARQLQRRGFQVTIYAASIPPDTTSNLSWASFTPSSGLTAGAASSAAWDAQFEAAARIAYQELQLLVGRKYGVSWVDSYSFRDQAPPPRRSDPNVPPRGWRMPAEVLSPGEHPFPARYAIRRPTLRIEPSPYLDALVRDVRQAGGRIVIRRFGALAEVQTLFERVVVNCTGLGARDLFDDPSIVPVKGQLTVLVPQSDVNYATFGGIPGRGTNGGFPVHMLPRADGIVLGGTSERGDWSLEPNEEAQRQIVAAHIELFRGMQ